MFKKIAIVILIVLIPYIVFAQEQGEKEVFLSAKNAYDQGSYAVSLDLFNRFVESFPSSKAMAEVQLYIGQCLFQEDKFIEAREVLTKLEKTYAPYGIEDRLLFWLGQVYLKVNDFAQSSEYFLKLIKMHPNSSLLFSAKMQLGWIYLQEGEYEDANLMFEASSDSEDVNIQEEALFKKGELQFQLKEYSDALKTLKIFSDVFLYSENIASAFFYMAESSYYLDDFDKAIIYYSKAKEKSDDYVIKALSFQGMGWCYLNQNKLKEAESMLSEVDKFIDVEFNKESLFFAKATLNYKFNRLEQAISYYDQLIGIYPESEMKIQALFGKAECFDGLMFFSEAISTFKEVIEEIAKDESGKYAGLLEKSYYNLGLAYLRVNDFEPAVSALKELVSLSKSPEFKLNALYSLGEAYQNSEDFNKAIELYSQILMDYPDNSYNDYVSYQLGISQLKAKQFNSAILSFKNFNRNFIDSEFLDDANYYLCYAYFINNELEVASGQLEKFVEIFKDSAYRDKAMYLLAVSFYNRGLYQEAIKYFEDILKEYWYEKDLAEKAEYEIAKSFYEMGDEKIAVRRFKQFTSSHPKSEITPSTIFWLGQYYRENSQFDLSRKSFEALVRMYPKHKLAQESKYEIGLIFLSEGKLNEALHALERLLDVCSDRILKAKTILAMGDLLTQEGKKQEAISIYKELTQMVSSNNIESEIKSSEEGKDSVSDRIEYNREIISSPAAISTKRIASVSETNENLEKQLAIVTYIKLGDLYRETKLYSEAMDAYNEALKVSIEDDSAEIQFKIAESLEENNKLEEALEKYSNISFVEESGKKWAVKGLLRSSRIYEDREEWQKAIYLYEKIISYDAPEAKYAQEKLDFINRQIKLN